MAEQSLSKGLSLQTVCEMTGYQPTEVALIARTVAVDAPLQELAVFLHACRTLGLDPLLRQAYWIRRKSSDGSMRGTLQVGIDGFRKIADSSGAYAGSDPPEYRDWFMLKGVEGQEFRCPGVARVTVRKIVQGRPSVFVGEAAWAEFYPGAGPVGAMWRKMPRHQLAKCAEAQALRKAFPSLLAAVPLADQDGSETVEITEVQPSRKELSDKYKAIYGEPEPQPQAEQPPPEPDEDDAPSSEEVAEEAERSKQWQRNRELAAQAAELRLRVPTIRNTATVAELRAANAELERRIQEQEGPTDGT